ncbi:MAG: hypothetical protein EP343_09455 [Deltaproteobacteria bacterium]|nr:MAG: hypothetical protein EP343_09455 [Deltaproteobacteria bacterium]
MKHYLPLVLCLLAVQACPTKKNSPVGKHKQGLKTKSPSKTRPTPLRLPLLGKIQRRYTKKEMKTCKTDKDCVLYCGNHHSCCGALCSCKTSVSAAFASKMRRMCAEVMKKKPARKCPVASCLRDTHSYASFCQKGFCETRATPFK